MLEFATASQNLPFAVVLGILIAFFFIELVGFLFGADLSGLLGEIDLPDIDVPDIDVPSVDLPDIGVPDPGLEAVPHGMNIGFVTSFLYWLNVGRVPIIILVVLFMTAFVVTGYALQLIVLGLAGFLLPGYLAAPAAFALALPVVKATGRTFGRIVPRDETEAISRSELVGSRAVITIGKARTGYPAQARVSDRFGTSHYLMLEPDDPNEELESGTSLLLVRFDGSRYYAIRHPEP